MQRFVLSMFVLGLAACDEVPELARLDHAQILAVRAEPAHVAPGGRARIDLLAGDDAGNVFEAQPDKLTVSGDAGPLDVERTVDGWFVIGGATPQIATVHVTIAIDGFDWRADKALVVNAPADNPRVATMQVDGAPSTEIVVPRGSQPELTAIGQGTEPLTYAWYSSVGDLQYYRQPTAILDAVDPAEGAIVVVIRDSVGGVGWQLLPARVE